jgi:hypothetical protein
MPALREALTARFLAPAGTGPSAASAAGGVIAGGAASPDPAGGGCVAGILLAPLVFVWRLVFPPQPTKEEDVVAVVDELRAAGRWS